MMDRQPCFNREFCCWQCNVFEDQELTQISPIFLNILDALPILDRKSFSNIVKTTYHLNWLIFCASLSKHNFWRLKYIFSVFSLYIRRPSLLAISYNLFVRNCNASASSVIRTKSSANLRPLVFHHFAQVFVLGTFIYFAELYADP